MTTTAPKTTTAPRTATAPRTWFITGAASGFGNEWAKAALDRGDQVAATARSVNRLDGLSSRYGGAVLPLKLDVTDRKQVSAAVAAAYERFGGLDVVVNNAGFGQLGMVEEINEDEIRASIETNLLGTLWVTQAVLPILRQQRSGHLIQVTSEGGITAFPQFGAYHASKWAVEGLSQSLRLEIAEFGIHVTCVEPGPYATEFGSRGLRRSTSNPAYDALRENIDRNSWVLGNPSATRTAILAVVDAEEPPSRIIFGRALEAIERDYAQRLSTWHAWQTTSLSAFGNPDASALSSI